MKELLIVLDVIIVLCYVLKESYLLDTYTKIFTTEIIKYLVFALK